MTRKEIRVFCSALLGVEGQAIAEAAILLPVFILVSFMLVDIQWMTKDAAAIEYIVNESARCEAIQSYSCVNTRSTNSYALSLAVNLRLNTGPGLQLTTPQCTPNVCTVTLDYHYKPLGAYFPALTITRTGTASVAPTDERD